MNQWFVYVADLLSKTFFTVVGSVAHNWIPLSLSILTAAVMKVYINTEKLKNALLNRPKISILASVALGAFTPFCACGTMAVIIGMLSTTLPWGAIMAFLTSSPLMSPDGFIMVAGILSPSFAIALTLASVVIGLGSGFLTSLIEKKTHYLDNQIRFKGVEETSPCGCAETPSCGCAQACACETESVFQDKDSLSAQGCCAAIQQPSPDALTAIGIRTGKVTAFFRSIRWRELAQAAWDLGVKQVLLYFSIFVAIGSLINTFIPTSIISGILGVNSLAAVPLASLIGLPLYVTTQSALPIITSLIQGGASQGAMLAFMITGAATSAYVIAGISAFLKKRVIALYLAFIMVGGIAAGYLYDLFLML